MKFQTIDDIIKNVNAIMLQVSKNEKSNRVATSQPVVMVLENPLLRFSCVPEMKDELAQSVAECIYAISGMNDLGFVPSFLDCSLTKQTVKSDNQSIGRYLRFYGEKSGWVLDHSTVNYLRSKGTGFTDQFQKAFLHLQKNTGSYTMLFQEPDSLGGQIIYAWVKKDDAGKLQMAVSCGEIEVTKELIVKIIPVFAFIQQLLSESAGIPLGTLTIMATSLYYDVSNFNRVKELSKIKVPSLKGLDSFEYPAGTLDLHDIDTLAAMMQEYASRLDRTSLYRANPFKDDNRVLLWSDMAEIVRANAAARYKDIITSANRFYHPQLKYIYEREAL
jgi:hypothetical protein